MRYIVTATDEQGNSAYLTGGIPTATDSPAYIRTLHGALVAMGRAVDDYGTSGYIRLDLTREGEFDPMLSIAVDEGVEVRLPTA